MINPTRKKTPREQAGQAHGFHVWLARAFVCWSRHGGHDQENVEIGQKERKKGFGPRSPS